MLSISACRVCSIWHIFPYGLVAVLTEASMPKQYVVRRDSEHKWVIGFDIVTIRPFATEAAAVLIAIKAAFSAGRQNHAGSKVLVEQEDAALHVVWTYGTDLPPV
jgi:hypothetical protein